MCRTQLVAMGMWLWAKWNLHHPAQEQEAINGKQILQNRQIRVTCLITNLALQLKGFPVLGILLPCMELDLLTFFTHLSLGKSCMVETETRMWDKL